MLTTPPPAVTRGDLCYVCMYAHPPPPPPNPPIIITIPQVVLGRVYQNIGPDGTEVANIAELQPGVSQLGLFPVIGRLGDSVARLRVRVPACVRACAPAGVGGLGVGCLVLALRAPLIVRQHDGTGERTWPHAWAGGVCGCGDVGWCGV